MPSSDSILQCPTRREVFEASLAGAQTRPFIPRLRSDPPPYQPLPHSLVEFRVQEGRENREHRLKQLWYSLPKKQKLEHDESEDEKEKKKAVIKDSPSPNTIMISPADLNRASWRPDLVIDEEGDIPILKPDLIAPLLPPHAFSTIGSADSTRPKGPRGHKGRR